VIHFLILFLKKYNGRKGIVGVLLTTTLIVATAGENVFY